MPLKGSPGARDMMERVNMDATILLSTTLRSAVPEYDSTTGIRWTFPGEMTVAQVCEGLGIPADKVKIVIVNGKDETLDYVVRGGDRVGLFPPVGGG